MPADNLATFPLSPDAELRALTSVLVERLALARQAGMSFGDARDLYTILGYERQLTSANYWARYRRGGLAKRIVECLPKATWRGDVEVVEDEDPEVSTEFEKAADALNTQLSVNARLEQADILSQLGYFAVLLIGAPGALDEELPKGKPGQLLFLRPFAGSASGLAFASGNSRGIASLYSSFADASILTWDTDPGSARFGMPLTYQLRVLNDTKAEFQLPVHWSRLIHLAEGCLDNDVYGTPALEPVWNLLDDLDKVTGGGAEAFFIKANAGIHADVDKTMGMPTTTSAATGSALTAPELNNLKEKMEEYQHKINRVILTRGVTLTELGATPADFSSQADAIITQIAGTKGIPKRVLTGSEMGELASSQDRENFKDIINGRQTGYAGPYIIRRFYDRLIAYGYLPTPKQYNVRWPHIQTLTEQEKADGAAKWAQVNATQGAVVFTENQIREKWYGMAPLSDEEEADFLSEMDKVRGALLMASINKTMGEVVFTNDEIRQKWEGLAPLPEADRKPVGAQGGAPPQLGGGSPPKLLGPAPSAVQTALEAAVGRGRARAAGLRAAMAAGDKETVRALLLGAAEAVGDGLRERLVDEDDGA